MFRGSRSQKRTAWQARLRRFERSKLSVVEFCRREKVAPASFYRWRRVLANSSSPVVARSSPQRPRFVPVQVAASTGLQASFPNGARLLIDTADHELVRISIEAIAQARATQGDA